MGVIEWLWLLGFVFWITAGGLLIATQRSLQKSMEAYDEAFELNMELSTKVLEFNRELTDDLTELEKQVHNLVIWARARGYGRPSPENPNIH